MPSESIRLDLPLLLPDVRDAQDACIGRLVRLLESRSGVVRAHVVRSGDPEFAEALAPPRKPLRGDVLLADGDGPQLCLHYDPERLTLAQIIELAKAAGAGVTERFGHAVISFRAVDTNLRVL